MGLALCRASVCPGQLKCKDAHIHTYIVHDRSWIGTSVKQGLPECMYVGLCTYVCVCACMCVCMYVCAHAGVYACNVLYVMYVFNVHIRVM